MAKDHSTSNGKIIAKYNEEIEADDTRCGVRWWRPKFLQRFATSPCYLLVYCYLGLVQGMYYTYFLAVISTIEKRFGISSKHTGFILSGNDISQIGSALFLAYYGGRGNRPRWISGGMMCMSFALIVMALPHLIYGGGKDALKVVEELEQADPMVAKKSSLCGEKDSGQENCDQETDTLMAMVIIFIGLILQGAGSTCYVNLGLPYLDDNTDPADTPLFFGINNTIRVLGPFSGFLLGYGCLRLYITPSVVPHLSPDDPRWMGAWWAGFIFIGILLFMGSLLVLLFPMQLPSAKARKERVLEEKEPVQKQVLTEQQPRKENFMLQMKELLSTVLRLLRTPIVVLSVLDGVFAVFGYVGFYTFNAKYIELQFRKSASDSSLYTGVSNVLVQAVGFAVSGAFIKVFKPRAWKLATWGAIVSCIQVVGFFSLMGIGCPAVSFQSSLNDNGITGMMTPCNTACECSKNVYSPVCDNLTNTSYYSPCFAGCTHASIKPDEEEDDEEAPYKRVKRFLRNKKKQKQYLYGECSCLDRTSTLDLSSRLPKSRNTSEDSGVVSYEEYKQLESGYCDDGCNQFIWYFTTLAIIKTIVSTARVGNMLIVMRAVDSRDKPMMMGIFMFVLSLFSFVPCPMVFGAIIDSTCLVWKEHCGGNANCLFYDMDKFRKYLHGGAAGFFAIALVFDIALVYFCKGLKLYDDKQGQHRMVELKMTKKRKESTSRKTSIDHLTDS